MTTVGGVTWISVDLPARRGYRAAGWIDLDRSCADRTDRGAGCDRCPNPPDASPLCREHSLQQPRESSVEVGASERQLSAAPPRFAGDDAGLPQHFHLMRPGGLGNVRTQRRAVDHVQRSVRKLTYQSQSRLVTERKEYSRQLDDVTVGVWEFRGLIHSSIIVEPSRECVVRSSNGSK